MNRVNYCFLIISITLATSISLPCGGKNKCLAHDHTKLTLSPIGNDINGTQDKTTNANYTLTEINSSGDASKSSIGAGLAVSPDEDSELAEPKKPNTLKPIYWRQPEPAQPPSVHQVGQFYQPPGYYPQMPYQQGKPSPGQTVFPPGSADEDSYDTFQYGGYFYNRITFQPPRTAPTRTTPMNPWVSKSSHLGQASREMAIATGKSVTGFFSNLFGKGKQNSTKFLGIFRKY